MAQAQLVRPKPPVVAATTATTAWTSVFPAEVKTEQKSLLFVKKLVAVGISTITYLRGIFPERAYGDKCCEGLNLKMLVDGGGCAGVNQLIQWITGAFDAIHNKYLRQLILAISTLEDPDSAALETYTFRFAYATDGSASVDKITSTTNSGSGIAVRDIKRPTLKMLRSIILLTQTLDHLPSNVFLSMRLLYYDQVTPPDYEPPGFRGTNADSYSFVFEPTVIRVGDVSTGFHSVKLRVHTARCQFEDDPILEEQASSQESAVDQYPPLQHCQVSPSDAPCSSRHGQSGDRSDLAAEGPREAASAANVAAAIPRVSTASPEHMDMIEGVSASSNGVTASLDADDRDLETTTTSSFRRFSHARRPSSLRGHSAAWTSPMQAVPGAREGNSGCNGQFGLASHDHEVPSSLSPSQTDATVNHAHVSLTLARGELGLSQSQESVLSPDSAVPGHVRGATKASVKTEDDAAQLPLDQTSYLTNSGTCPQSSATGSENHSLLLEKTRTLTAKLLSESSEDDYRKCQLNDKNDTPSLYNRPLNDEDETPLLVSGSNSLTLRLQGSSGSLSAPDEMDGNNNCTSKISGTEGKHPLEDGDGKALRTVAVLAGSPVAAPSTNGNVTPATTPYLQRPGSACSNMSQCSVRSVSVALAPSRPSPGYPVRCPCQVPADDGLMILCDICGYWQHGACFSLLEERDAPTRHVCQLCSDPPSLCTDPRLCTLTPARLSSTCLFRRSLALLCTEASSSPPSLSSVALAHRLGSNISQATAVLDKLQQLGVLQQPHPPTSSGRESRLRNQARNLKIDREVLHKLVIPKYFLEKDSEPMEWSSEGEEEPQPVLPSQEWAPPAKRPKASVTLEIASTSGGSRRAAAP